MGRTDAVAFTLECVKAWRELGARVTFEPGFETRGNGTSADYEGGTPHHTASNSSAATPFPTRNILINGRTDLHGPLCNVAGPWCTEDDPWLHVIAANPANHAGASGGRSMGPLPVTNLFNRRVFGLEIDYPGTSPMSAGQRRAALIFTAGLTRVLRRPSTEWVRGHAETSITGKWDPGYESGRTIDLDAFRRDAAAVTAPQAPAPLPAPRDLEDFTMYLKCKPDPAKPDVLVGILSGSLLVGLGSQGEKDSAELAIQAGATVQWVEKFTWDAFDRASHALHDNPRPVVTTNPVPAATAGS